MIIDQRILTSITLSKKAYDYKSRCAHVQLGEGGGVWYSRVR